MNQKIRNASKKIYKDIVFDSGLELFCYKELEKAGLEFEYQPNPYILLNKFKCEFDSYEVKGKIYRDANRKIIKSTKRFDISNNVRPISYTTDFRAIDDSWIIETKGYANESFPLRWKLFKQLLNEIGFRGKLFKPTNQKEVLECIKIIQNETI